MWWQPFFWILLVPTLIVMGIFYGTSRKLYKAFYVLAIFTYAISVAYPIDAFELGKNWTLGLLALSAVLMLTLGYMLTRRPEREEPKRKGKPRGFLVWVLVILGVMLALILLGSFAGYQRSEQLVASISRTDFLTNTNEPLGIGTITYTGNSVIPAVIKDRYFMACWYDPATNRFPGIGPNLLIDGKDQYEQGQASFEVGGQPETVELKLTRFYSSEKVPQPVATVPVMPAQETFDAVVIAASADPWQCPQLAQLRKDGKLTLDTTIQVAK
jgi:hypothetical protein